MSAISDTQQGITFIYTNFYDHYKNLSQVKGIVLKTASAPTPAEVTVVSSEQQSELSQWVNQSRSQGKQQLAKSLNELRDTRKRFTFLMAEIENLLKS